MTRFIALDEQTGAVVEVSPAPRKRSRNMPLASVSSAFGAQFDEEVVAAICQARLHEPDVDLRGEVRIQLGWLSGAVGETTKSLRDVCCAASVLADRATRNAWSPQADVVVVTGCWRDDGADMAQRPAPSTEVLAAWLSELASQRAPGAEWRWFGSFSPNSAASHQLMDAGIRYALLPEPRRCNQVTSARAWFPTVSSNGSAGVELIAIEVHSRAWRHPDSAHHKAQEAQALDDALIYVVGLDRIAAEVARRVLCDARALGDAYDEASLTVVRFSQQFTHESYQLALVVADRMARGLEHPPLGRLIATGRSSAWAQGVVEWVGEADRKLPYLTSVLATGDRIVLPAAWSEEHRDAIALLKSHPLVRAGTASVALVDRIGFDVCPLGDG